MSNVFAVLWFITLFAFIILIFVKRGKRIAAGDNYKADPVCLKVSKIKRIVGIICLLCPFACLITAPKTQDKPPVEQVQVQQEQMNIDTLKAFENADKTVLQTNCRQAEDVDEEYRSLSPEIRDFLGL